MQPGGHVPSPFRSPLNGARPPRPIPDAGGLLALQAAPVAASGARLLTKAAGVLLGVTVAAAPDGSEARMAFWDFGLGISGDLVRLDRIDRRRLGVDGLVEAARKLAAALAPRWPAYARPPRLGFVTDGSGVGFCPEDPCPLAPRWLERQLDGTNRLTSLTSFGETGAWTLLTMPPSAGPLH